MVWKKTISDSRTCVGVDVHGTKNFFVSPFGGSSGKRTNIGIIRFHTRCLSYEVSNIRKALISNKYINEIDSDEQVVDKMFTLANSAGSATNRSTILQDIEVPGLGGTKFFFYLKYLLGRITNKTFYEQLNQVPTKHNVDFSAFLNEARVQFGSVW